MVTYKFRKKHKHKTPKYITMIKYKTDTQTASFCQKLCHLENDMI